MVVVHGPGRQASRLRLWSIAKALFDCCGDVEQAPVLAVAGDQHQTGREAILPRQRQRDRAKIEEIDRIGIAQWSEIVKDANDLILSKVAVPDFSRSVSETLSPRVSSES